MDELSYSKRDALLSCIAYCTVSCCMILVNKSLATIFAFRSSFGLIFFQNSVTVIALLVANNIGFVKFTKWNTKVALKWLTVQIFFSSMLITSFLSVRHLGTHIIVIFKNLTNILICFGDRFFFGRKASSGTLFSLFLMVFSSVVAGFSDLYFHLGGYMWMLANCLSTAVYQLLQKWLLQDKEVDQGKWGNSYYNNMLSMPILFPMIFISGDHTFIQSFFHAQHGVAFWIVFVFSGMLGMLISICSLWCLKSTSPTTFSMIGALNKIPVSIIGMFLFRTKMSPAGYFSLLVAISAGILFGISKTKQANSPPTEQSTPQQKQQQHTQDPQKPSPTPDPTPTPTPTHTPINTPPGSPAPSGYRTTPQGKLQRNEPKMVLLPYPPLVHETDDPVKSPV